MSSIISLAKFEAVDGAYDALLRHGDFETTDDPRGYIRKSQVLLDACLDAGMSYDEPSPRLWAAEFVSSFLLAA